jgi:leucyl-tRNA synthetase
LTVPADATAQELERLALEDPHVKSHTAGRTVVKVVVVPGKLVSLVTTT